MKRVARKLPSAAAVALAFCLWAACSPKPPSDEVLTAEIEARLTANPITHPAEVKVVVRDGIATLSGSVSSSDVVRQADLLASAVTGVRSVRNEMTLQQMTIAESTPVTYDPSATGPIADVRAAQHEEMARHDSDPPPSTTTAKTGSLTIPAGQHFSVRLLEPVNTATQQDGHLYRATLSTPLRQEDRLVIPVGTPAVVLLMKSNNLFQLRVTGINYHGQRQAVSTNAFAKSEPTRLAADTQLNLRLTQPLVLPQE